MSFFAELRRRSVFKVGAAYAVVAWLLLQITDVVLPTFNSPQWVAQTITFVLAIGFPIAVVLAWALDLTPQGIKVSSTDAGEARAQPTANRFANVTQTLILLAVGFLVLDQYVLDGSSTEQRPTANTSFAEGASMRPVRRYELNLGDTGVLGNSQLQAHLALSKDGRYLVYAARAGNTAQLFLRDLNRFEGTAIQGTEGAYHPFFSPSEEWVGFYSDETDSKLKRISLRGGSSQILSDAVFSAGGTWTEDDTIFYSTRDPSGGRSLFRIPAGGGDAELLLESNDQEGYITPETLPGTESLLIVVRPGPGGGGNAREGSVALFSPSSGELRTLIRGGFRPQYVPSGHIVFVRDGDLWAVPFDLNQLDTIGTEVRLVSNVQSGAYEGGAAYTVSDEGLLIYVPGGEVSSALTVRRDLIWVDRQGNVESVTAAQNRYGHPRISPDGRSLALTIGGPGGADVWTYDFARDTFNRLTFDGAEQPVWSPDGERIAYSSLLGSIETLLWRPADGTGQAEAIRSTVDSNIATARSFSPDGNWLLAQGCNFGPCDVALLPVADGGEATMLLDGGVYSVHDGAISPDGRWLAYGSSETGREEVYVRPFPDIDAGKWQVSGANGGAEPRWGASSDELFYRNGTAVVSVSIDVEGGFTAGRPTILFQDSRYAFGTNVQGRPSYDVSPDGQRFLLLRTATERESEEQLTGTRVIVVDNWFEELRRLAPAD